MSDPEVGLVIPYDYLWRHQHERGEESGRKTRPCILVVVAVKSGSKKTVVLVVPMTTKEPSHLRSFIEISPRVNQHLGLKAEKSWVICDEYNQLDWPSPDVSKTPTGAMSFGNIPYALISKIRSEMQAAIKRGQLKKVLRTE